jgi:hypothetical protein
MAMIESDDMSHSDRSKGTSGGSSNWSPWNMNMDQLQHMGCDSACAKSLGQGPSFDVDKAMDYLLSGLRGETDIGDACDFMHFHRDGTTGWNACKGRGCSCEGECKGCSSYTMAVADGAKQILADPSLGTAGNRVCESIPHIG